MTNPTQAEYTDLLHKVSSGELMNATREELTRYSMILSHAFAHTHFGHPQFTIICETVRVLLAARMSEEESRRAATLYETESRRTRRTSNIAISIAVVAAVASIVQAVDAVLRH
jgi:hypothetical protein